MKKAKLITLEQTDNASLYSICFDGNAISEYEAFVQKFKDDAMLNTDYKNILMALEKIVTVGALLSGYVMDLQAFDKMLAEAQKEGSVTIEKNVITGIEGKVFQLL